MSVRTIDSPTALRRRLEELADLDARSVYVTTTAGLTHELDVSVGHGADLLRIDRATGALALDDNTTRVDLAADLSDLADVTVGGSFHPRTSGVAHGSAPARHTLGRCRTCDRAYCWPSSAGKLGDVTCPRCGADLAATTRRWRVTDSRGGSWFELDRETVREVSRRGAAIRRAIDDQRVARGTAKRAEDVEPGDVLGYSGAALVVDVEPLEGRPSELVLVLGMVRSRVSADDPDREVTFEVYTVRQLAKRDRVFDVLDAAPDRGATARHLLELAADPYRLAGLRFRYVSGQLEQARRELDRLERAYDGASGPVLERARREVLAREVELEERHAAVLEAGDEVVEVGPTIGGYPVPAGGASDAPHPALTRHLSELDDEQDDEAWRCQTCGGMQHAEGCAELIPCDVCGLRGCTGPHDGVGATVVELDARRTEVYVPVHELRPGDRIVLEPEPGQELELVVVTVLLDPDRATATFAVRGGWRVPTAGAPVVRLTGRA